jgi:hypothetical protein
VSEHADQRSTSSPILLPMAEESVLPILVPITSGRTDTRSIGDSSSVGADVNLVSSSGPNRGSSRSTGNGVWVSWEDIATLEYDHAVCGRELARLADELANCRAALAAFNSGFAQLQISLVGATAFQGICQVGITRVSSTLEKIDRRPKT